MAGQQTETRYEQAFRSGVRMERTDMGWTLDELAKRAGIHLQTLHRIETGLRGCGLDTACAIAAALGVSLDQLCGLPVGEDRDVG